VAIETTQTGNPGVAVIFTPEAFADIEADAKKHGLSPSSYLTIIHAIQSGRASPATLEAIGDLYRNDRDVLRELAK